MSSSATLLVTNQQATQPQLPINAFCTLPARLCTMASLHEGLSQHHSWIELIDRSSFSSPDRFKLHSFI
ncbi:hypothetical protein Bca101_062109 [Brassica carinata]